MSLGTADESMNGGMASEYESPFPGMQTGLQQCPYKCSVCEKGLISRQSLSEHMILHTKESPHRCRICGKGFTRGPKLSEHMMLHTGERPYKCTLCGKGFIRRFRFTEHMITHSGKMPFECTICGRGYAAKYRMMEHARRHALKGSKRGYKQKSLQRNLGLNNDRCKPKTLSVGTAGRNEIDVMIDLTEGETSDIDVPNDITLEDFEQVDQELEGTKTRNSRTHILTIDKGVCIGLGELLRCSLCKAEFSTKDDLCSHMSVHSQVLPFKCALCERRFSSRDELSKHMPTHASAMYNTCDVCAESFTRINDLRKHKTEAHAAAHNQEKSQSSTAVRTLSVDSSPKDIVTPTTEVIYECIVCGEGYTDKTDLRNHMMEHNESLGQNRVFLNEIDDDLGLSINKPHQHIQGINMTRTNSIDSEEDLLTSSIPTNQVIDLTDEVPDGSIHQGEGSTRQMDVQNQSTVRVIEPCESTSSEEEDLNQTSNTSHVNYQLLNISDTSSSGMSDLFEGSATYPNESNPNQNNHNTNELHNPSVLTDDGRDNDVAVSQDDFGDVIDLTDDPPCAVQEYSLAETHDESMTAGMHSQYESQLTRPGMGINPQNPQGYNLAKTHDELMIVGMCAEYESQFTRPGMEINPQNNAFQHKCSVCGKRCVSQRSLSEHMILHTHESPYRCTFCRKVFTRKQKLDSHVMLHTGERPYTCTVCGKGFIKKHRLQEHMPTHSGKLPFECAECEKGFTTNYKLTEHARIHSGEKPYQCRICGVAYRVKAGLNEHIFTHGIEKPYPCSVCDKGFTNRKTLYYHEMARHSGIRPFKCTICSKGFVRNSELKKHMRAPC